MYDQNNAIANKVFNTTLERALNESKRELPKNLVIDEKYKILDEFWTKMLDESKIVPNLKNFDEIRQDFIRKFHFCTAVLSILANNNAFIGSNNTSQTGNPGNRFSICAVYSFILSEIANIDTSYVLLFRNSVKKTFDSMVATIEEIKRYSDNDKKIEETGVNGESVSKLNTLDPATRIALDLLERIVNYYKISNLKFYNLFLSVWLVDHFQAILAIHRDFIKNNDETESSEVLKYRCTQYIYETIQIITFLFNMAIPPENMDAFIEKIKGTNSKCVYTKQLISQQ